VIEEKYKSCEERERGREGEEEEEKLAGCVIWTRKQGKWGRKCWW